MAATCGGWPTRWISPVTRWNCTGTWKRPTCPKTCLPPKPAALRKVYCSAREQGISCDGEYLAGPDLGESPRLFSTTAGDILGTNLMHLAEGSKGFLYWVWNALQEGPNAGAWSLRNLDGSPSERSRMAARFGRMVLRHNDLLYDMRPADTHVAIFDSFDAAIYLHRRSHFEPMSDWYAANQYGFFKALHKPAWVAILSTSEAWPARQSNITRASMCLSPCA